MKKLIAILLLGALLTLSFVGCNEQPNSGVTPNNTDNTTTPEVTTPEPDVTVPEETTPREDTQNNSTLQKSELDKDSELIVNLIAYLDQIYVSYNPFFPPFYGKIDAIKEGAQPLHVAFDPANYYFVCGYYNPTEEDDEWNYCCATKYTWVQYENETEITEYYNDRKLIAAFQINRALAVTDLVTGEATNNMEHFQMYEPVFENGINKEPPLVFEETFIYLNNFLNHFDDDMIYHSIFWYYHRGYSINCVCLDDQYYIPFHLGTLKTDQLFDAQDALSQEYVLYEFSEYYNAIVGVMDTEKYRKNAPANGYVYYYGVISLGDFVNEIIE